MIAPIQKFDFRSCCWRYDHPRACCFGKWRAKCDWRLNPWNACVCQHHVVPVSQCFVGYAINMADEEWIFHSTVWSSFFAEFFTMNPPELRYIVKTTVLKYLVCSSDVSRDHLVMLEYFRGWGQGVFRRRNSYTDHWRLSQSTYWWTASYSVTASSKTSKTNQLYSSVVQWTSKGSREVCVLWMLLRSSCTSCCISFACSDVVFTKFDYDPTSVCSNPPMHLLHLIFRCLLMLKVILYLFWKRINNLKVMYKIIFCCRCQQLQVLDFSECVHLLHPTVFCCIREKASNLVSLSLENSEVVSDDIVQVCWALPVIEH